MADDAFAPSPRSARALPPGDADFIAMRDAFAETARGRWFLDEFAQRNRNADTSMVLEAMARIEANVATRAPEATSANDAIAAIRDMIDEARTAADAAMTLPGSESILSAGRRAARIIREIAWSLREGGTDLRICDILDTQLGAIDAVHDFNAKDARRGSISEVFDDLNLRIEEIAAEAALPRRTAATAARPKAEPVETIGANDGLAAAEIGPSQPALQQQEASHQQEVSHQQDVAGLSEPDDAQDRALDAAQDSGESPQRPTSTEIAADEAVLDLIALEMAAPDVADAEKPDPVASDLAELSQLANSMIAELPDPAWTPPTHVQPEARSLSPPSQPSLGAALIASGIVPRPRADNDPLAPFRRMSQIEKIALFS